MRGAQPVRRDHAHDGDRRAVPRRRLSALRARRARVGPPAAERVAVAADPDAPAVQEPRQRRHLRRGAVALAGREGRGGGRVPADRDLREHAARRGRRRARRAVRRQGPRPRRRGARELRAGLRPRRARHGPRRGHVGASHGRGDRRVRPRQRPAGVGAGRQGGVGGRGAAGPRHPHARLAAAHRREVERVRRLLDLPDEPRGRAAARVDRVRRGAEPPRRDALGPRRPAAVQDAPAHPADPGRRQARRVGREGDPRGRLLGDAPAARARHGIAGDAAGMVNVPELKGVHYAMAAGIMAADEIVSRAARARPTSPATGRRSASRSSTSDCAARAT